MNPLRSFLVALQFLTRLPTPLPRVTDKRTIGNSLHYYPIVGLVLGLLLTGLNFLLVGSPAMLRASLVTAAWVLLTGALHLDGLADSADAWIGGLGNRKGTLDIMKDPHCGPAAVVTLIVILLIKFSALHNFKSADWLVLAFIPILARAAIPLLFLTTRYVRPGGLGAILATSHSRVGSGVILAVTVVFTVLIGGVRGVWLLVVLLATFTLLRRMMINRIGGTTGDTAGALIEISEASMLVTAVLVQG